MTTARYIQLVLDNAWHELNSPFQYISILAFSGFHFFPYSLVEFNKSAKKRGWKSYNRICLRTLPGFLSVRDTLMEYSAVETQ